MFKAKENGGVGIKANDIGMLSDGDLKKFVETDMFFVDSSGWGEEGDPALTLDQFLKKIKAGRYYAVIEAGQFQVFVGEYVLKGEEDD